MTVEFVMPLLKALDDLEMHDALPDARAHRARIAELHNEAAAGHRRAAEERAALAGQVAAGELTISEAAEQAARSAVWLSRGEEYRTPPAMILEAAVAEIDRMTVKAIQAAAHDLYQQLAARARAAVERATTAARAAVDLGPIIDAVTDQVGDADERACAEGRDEFLALSIIGSFQLGGRDSGLFGDTLKGVDQYDARRTKAWADAAAAHAEFVNVHTAAKMLREVTRRRSGDPVALAYGVETHQRSRMVIDQLPVPLRLAVAAALGWRPGLYGDELFPVPDRPRGSAGRRALAVLGIS